MTSDNVVNINCGQNAQSEPDSMGMRTMQKRAFEKRNSQYILIKSPPASGKSRALMFLGLDKLIHQNISKVIVAVPETSIGSSFKKTELAKFGFFADWEPNDYFNLCLEGSGNKGAKFKQFVDCKSDNILICTHSTLRNSLKDLEPSMFDNFLIAIDEFHHVSEKDTSVLGTILKGLMNDSSAHIVAMTGSYFRGDAVSVMSPEDEAKFDVVTFDYYEQLSEYKHLKTIGIGYHFYNGDYLKAIGEVLDIKKKTIIHIPNVNSLASGVMDKYQQVDSILDNIGTYLYQDGESGLHLLSDNENNLIKVADLVNENNRDKVQLFLRNVSNIDDVDIIIALGMAKEGFDWPYCEHALTVGHRNSLTEVIQILGRCTRDSENKTHAQFTNLIAEPDATGDEVNYAVNTLLKAITCSLLMEQVLAPTIELRPKELGEMKPKASGKKRTVEIDGLKTPKSDKAKEIISSQINDVKTAIMQTEEIINAYAGNGDMEVVNKAMVAEVIKEKFPDLDADDVEAVRQHVVADMVIAPNIDKAPKPKAGDRGFIKLADKFVDVDRLEIDLIDSINPFHNAFEVMSKTMDGKVLKQIKSAVASVRRDFTIAEINILWPKIFKFRQERGREPDIASFDDTEKEMAQCLAFILKERQRMGI